MSSKVSRFYIKSPDERLEFVKRFASLTAEEALLYRRHGYFEPEFVNYLSENVFASHPLPLSIAVNFIINGRELLIPLAIEEPGVVAGISFAAKLCRSTGGFKAQADEPIMIGQILLTKIKNYQKAIQSIHSTKEDLVQRTIEHGKIEDLQPRLLNTERGKMLCVYVYVNVGNKCGAKTTANICEALSPKLAEITGGTVRLALHANLAIKRLARAEAVWKAHELEKYSHHGSGEEIVDGILDLCAFACVDPFRACTHNKGILNGIDALCVATGNDWRIIESGAHAYASLGGRYLPLTKYHKTIEGDLCGRIEIPIAMGVTGGVIHLHPYASTAMKIMGVTTSKEIAEIAASVGLAANFAALRALSTGELSKGDAKLSKIATGKTRKE